MGVGKGKGRGYSPFWIWRLTGKMSEGRLEGDKMFCTLF